MAAPEEKSFCVLEYHTNKSVVTVQRAFRAKYVKIFFPPLPCDIADLKPLNIAAVKNIDAPMLTRVCGKKLNIVSMCAASPLMHTSNTYSCQKVLFFSFPVALNNSIVVVSLMQMNLC